MDSTPNLNLPYLAAAQSQKHVTHNEAIRALDALVNLSVIDRTHAGPPAAPAEGDRYIVAAPATGAWLSQETKIAAFQDGAWMFYAPLTGWTAWVAADKFTVAYHDGSWQPVTTQVSGAAVFGINATADTTNRLVVAAPSSLFNNDGHGHQIKINKASATDTASLLYQDGYSGRAEIGLAGDDDLHIKVSADGASWHDAILVHGSTGQVTFPNTSLSGYTLPPATASALGGVIAGSGLSVGGDGTLTAPAPNFAAITSKPTTVAGYGITDSYTKSESNAAFDTAGAAAAVGSAITASLKPVATSGSYTDLTNKPTIPPAYTLPVATATALGGVKQGTGVAIAADGTLSASAYTLPAATTTTLGGVKQGTGVTIAADGTLSASAGAAAGTAGQVQFSAGSGVFATDANLTWDNTNKRLGLGIATPNAQLELTGVLRLAPTTSATVGVITKGAATFLHDFAGTGTNGQNIFIGQQAGNFTMGGTATQGSNNIAIGYQSQKAITTGSYNSALGYQSLAANTTGGQNTAIGYGALTANTTGTNCSALGYQSLAANTTGASNAAFGSSALQKTTTGGYNSAFGISALQSNTTANNNAGFGINTLQWNLTGGQNTALGAYALNFSTGNYNTAAGAYALEYISGASNNTAFGNTALVDLNAPLAATALVAATSYVIASAGTTSFTAIGAASNAVGTIFTATGPGTGTGTALLASNPTNNNTALGYNTGRGIATGSGNTIIGANITSLAAGLTNTVIIANGSGGAAGTYAFQSDSASNTFFAGASLAAAATGGFVYLPNIAGTPTGTPSASTGRSPIVIDWANNKLWAYNGTIWKGATLA